MYQKKYNNNIIFLSCGRLNLPSFNGRIILTKDNVSHTAAEQAKKDLAI